MTDHRQTPHNGPDFGQSCNGSADPRRVALLDEPGTKPLAGTSRPLTARPVGARAAMRPAAAAPAGAPAEPFAEELDTVCEGVARLAATAGRAPSRIRLQVGLTSVEVEWPEAAAPAPPAVATAAATAATAATADVAAVVAMAADAAAPAGAAEPAGLAYVCAPTVGTFYHRPSPDAEPFVRPGDHVNVGQPIGIIEVMKMMSTVTADASGRVTEVLVADGHPVEFGERLVAVDTTPEAG